MNRARHELLAGSALSADEDGHVRVGHAADEVVHLTHVVAHAEQLADDTRVPALAALAARRHIRALTRNREHLAFAHGVKLLGIGHFDVEMVTRRSSAS